MSAPDLPEPFELHGAHPIPSELPSRAWMFVKKHHQQTADTVRLERSKLLETTSRISQTAENAARLLGLLTHEIGRARERHIRAGADSDELRHLSIQAEAALHAAGVRIDDPIGQVLDDALLGRCRIIDNLPHPGVREHVVGETITPAILFGPKVIHLAEIIGWLPVPDTTGD